MGLVNVDLNNVSPDDDNFDDVDPETIIHARLMAWCNRYKHLKACEKEMVRLVYVRRRNNRD